MRQPNYADNCVLSSSGRGGGVSAADKCLSVTAPPAHTHLLRAAERCYGSGRLLLPMAELQQQQPGYKQCSERIKTQAGPDIFHSAHRCTCVTIRRCGSGGAGAASATWLPHCAASVSAAVRSRCGLRPSCQRCLPQAEGNRPPP